MDLLGIWLLSVCLDLAGKSWALFLRLILILGKRIADLIYSLVYASHIPKRGPVARSVFLSLCGLIIRWSAGIRLLVWLGELVQRVEERGECCCSV